LALVKLIYFVCTAGATCNIGFLWFYWINVSLGAIFGIMAILIALLTNVFGQGLALRGPLGSMVRYDYLYNDFAIFHGYGLSR
jgi:apolipoprotein N-acyltransferase